MTHDINDNPIYVLFCLSLVIAGPVLLMRACKNSEGLKKIIDHFQNYAIIGIIWLLMAPLNKTLETGDDLNLEKWKAFVLIHGFIFLFFGLAVANYFFGCRAIVDFFKKAKYGTVKSVITCVFYTVLIVDAAFVLHD